MKFGLQTWGTKGDFRPFFALATGLKKAGHEVQLVHTAVDGKDYSEDAISADIELFQTHVGEKLAADFNPYNMGKKPGSFGEYTKLLNTYYEPLTEQMYAASRKLCAESDVVIGHSVCHTLLTAAEKTGTPRVSLALVPLVIESNQLSPLGTDFGKLINRLLWRAGDFVSTKMWFQGGQVIRNREGLPKLSSLQQQLFQSSELTIVATSPTLIEPNYYQSDHVRVTGFLNPNDETEFKMDSELLSFINNGPKPIFMTFGSCMQYNLNKETHLLIEAARASGQRAIIQSDWSTIEKPTDENIYCVGPVPHQKVFSKCSLVVHHGGAGTTQTALRCAVPSVVVPHGFDQMYWAQLVHRQSLGGRPLASSSITPKELATEIIKVLRNEEINDTCSEIGSTLRTENGVDITVKTLEKHFNK